MLSCGDLVAAAPLFFVGQQRSSPQIGHIQREEVFSLAFFRETLRVSLFPLSLFHTWNKKKKLKGRGRDSGKILQIKKKKMHFPTFDQTLHPKFSHSERVLLI